MATETKRVHSKRRYPRRRFNKRVGMLFHGKYEITKSSQIGEGGMMAVAPWELTENDKVVLSFLVPGRDFVLVRAQVQYIVPPDDTNEQPQYGFKFLNITFEDRRMLRDFIAAKTEAEAMLERL